MKFFILLLLSIFLNAATMFTLSGIKEVYPVVELPKNLFNKELQKYAKTEIKAMLDDLGINYKGYNQRSIALLASYKQIKGINLITLKLVIGEEVKRLDTKQKTFALTYLNQKSFFIDTKDDIEDKFEDALIELLDKFNEQYKEENKYIKKIKSKLKFETSYDKALEKAKKLNKPLMLILVTNYCPWCKKFEDRVLYKKDIYEKIKKDFVAVIINKEKDKFPKKFDKSITPIIHFIDPKTQKSFKTIVGYHNKDEFIYIIKRGINY